MAVEGMPAPPPPIRTRSWILTALSWAIIAVSGPAIAISLIAFIMVLARGPGTSSNDLLGFLLVVAAPPLTLIAAIGLLHRKRWARFYMLALLVGGLAFSLREALRPPRPETTRYSADGVMTTTLASTGTYSASVVVIAALGLAILLAPSIAAEFRDPRP